MKHLIVSLFCLIFILGSCFPSQAQYIYKRGYHTDGLCPAKNGPFDDSKWGYVNEYDKWVIKPEYSWGGQFKRGFAPVRKGIKYGFINKQGKVVIPCIYDDYLYYGDQSFSGYYKDVHYEGLIVLTGEGGKGMVLDGKIIVPCKYWGTDVVAYDETIIALAGGKNDKMDIYDLNGNKINPDGYYIPQKNYWRSNYIYPITDGKVMGVIDVKSQKIILEPQFDMVNFADNYAIVEKDGKSGLYDLEGKQVLPIQYDTIRYEKKYGNLLHDRFYLSKGGQFSVIDKDGTVLIPEGCAFNGNVVSFNGKYGLTDKLDLILDIEYDAIELYNEYQFMGDRYYSYLVKKDGKLGVYDLNNKRFIYDVKYDEIEEDPEGIGYTFLKKDGYWGGVSNGGGQNVLLPFIFDKITRESKDHYLAKHGNEWQYYNRYHLIDSFDAMPLKLMEDDDNLYKVFVKGKYGIYRYGFLIEPQYDEIEFLGGTNDRYDMFKYDYYFALKKDNGFQIWREYQFSLYFEPIGKSLGVYEEVGKVGENLIPIKNKGKWGYINIDGVVSIKPKFSYASKFVNGKATVKKGKKEFQIGRDGKKIK